MHRGNRFPGSAGVVRAEDVAGLLVLYTPRRDVHLVGILGVDREVVDDVIVTAAQMGKPGPAMAGIAGNEDLAGAGAEKKMIGVFRIVGEAANIASVRSESSPLASPRGGAEQKQSTDNAELAHGSVSCQSHT